MAYRFQLVPNTQKGQVYPPLMTVSYSDILITDPAKQTVAVGIHKVYSEYVHACVYMCYLLHVCIFRYHSLWSMRWIRMKLELKLM